MKNLILTAMFRFLTILLFLHFSINLYAVPAKPGRISYSQPDGSSIDVFLHGDEHRHFVSSTDGFPLLKGDDGVFRYAVVDPATNVCVPSNIVAHNINERSVAESSFVASIDKQACLATLDAASSRVKVRKAAPSKVAPENGFCKFPSKGSPKAIAILVEFSDNSFTLSNPYQEFYDQLNKENYSAWSATGSIHDYFKASSNGQFTPQFDVYGPVKLSKPMSYYGADDPKLGTDPNAHKMISDACALLDDKIDFTQYDCDNDGFIDNVYVFYAGYGQADGGADNTIWPHSWDIYDGAQESYYFDGKRLNHYACSSELRDGKGSTISGIGVFCHEFCHVLGLPDLYSTSYTSAFTPGTWSILDRGSYNNDSWTPPYLTAYERYCLNWFEPKVLDTPQNVNMHSISDVGFYNDAYIIHTDKEYEYYILENRQQSGWDKYIPSHGMLVWHIDFLPGIWEMNVVNVIGGHQYVDIVEADGEPSSYSISGDPFPGEKNITEFTDDTKPSMISWSGTRLYSPITNIKETDGIISFAFKGGVDIFDKVVATDASDVKAGSFSANWNKVSQANNYLVNIYTKTGSSRTYIDGWSMKEAGNTNSILVSGLTPETEYYFNVIATDGKFYSNESNEVKVTTTAPTLDFKKVNALPASNVDGDGFTANWDKIADADFYKLTVYTSQLGEAYTDVVDFTGKLEALPDNWTTNCTSTYALSSYCGDSAPSLKMDKDGAYIKSPSYNDGIRYVNFWYRGNKADAANSIDISALNAKGAWVVIKTISPIVNETGGEKVAIDVQGLGYKAIMIKYNSNGTGNLAVDDIVIGHGGEYTDLPIAQYNALNVGNVNTYEVSGLMPSTSYSYDVTAFNSEFASITSEKVKVNTTSSSGISAVSNNNHKCWTSNGFVYVQVPASTQVTIFDTLGRVIASSAISEGTYSFDMSCAPAGLYIVKVGQASYKISL